MFDMKQRDGREYSSSLEESFHRILVALRRIGDTKSRLESIYAKQRQLNVSVAVVEHDRRAAHLMSKMTVC